MLNNVRVKVEEESEVSLELLSTWMAFGGNTCDLDSIWEETDKNSTRNLISRGHTVRGKGVTNPDVATNVVPPTPTSPSPSSPVIPSSPPHQPPCPPQPQDAEGSSILFQQVLATCSAFALRVEGLENDKAAKQLEIYNIDLDHSSKVLSIREDATEVQEAVEIVAAASTPIHAAKPKTLTITAAPAVSTRRRKGVVIRDPEEELHYDTLDETPTVKDKGKGILIEAPKPMKKKDHIELDAEYARKLQEEINKEHEESYKNID
nr:hypothetical protein [Tanacetum cinerariifolium]